MLKRRVPILLKHKTFFSLHCTVGLHVCLLSSRESGSAAASYDSKIHLFSQTALLEYFTLSTIFALRYKGNIVPEIITCMPTWCHSVLLFVCLGLKYGHKYTHIAFTHCVHIKSSCDFVMIFDIQVFWIIFLKTLNNLKPMLLGGFLMCGMALQFS